MPDFAKEIAERLAGLRLPAGRDEEIVRELNDHLEERHDELVGSGMTAAQAFNAALNELGHHEALSAQLKSIEHSVRAEPVVFPSATSAAWMPNLVSTVSADLRYAIRQLRKAPAFSVVAISTLAIGIGAASAVFSQVNAVFWNSLPVRSPAQLRLLTWVTPKSQRPNYAFSQSAYSMFRDHAKSFSDVACSWSQNSIAEWGPLRYQLVSGNYFQTLGVRPTLGRTITPDDDQPGRAAQVAVINYDVWQRAYGGNPDVLHQTVTIKNTTFQIIGVTPVGFAGVDPTTPRDVVVPLGSRSLRPANVTNPWNTCNEVVGRLRSEASEEQAHAEASLLFARAILEDPPQDAQQARLLVTDLLNIRSLVDLRKGMSRPLLLLLFTAGLILLITCANIAGLLLARGRARQNEVATRFAVGAPRSRIVRQLLIESLLLSSCGGALGILLAYEVSPLLPGILSELSGERDWLNPALTLGMDPTPDARVLGFSIALTVLTGLVFGLLPALRATPANLVSTLKQTSLTRVSGVFRLRTGKALVGLQVGMSMVLLIGAGMLLKTVANLKAVHVGYEPEGLVFVTTDPNRSGGGLVESGLNRLQALPGVRSVTVSQWPIYNNAEPKFAVCVPGSTTSEDSLDLEPIAPRFFETWGVPLVDGRDFNSTSEQAAIVNEAFAKKFFGGKRAVGHELSLGRCPGKPRTIVGIVADHKDRERVPVMPMVYIPYARTTAPSTFAIRTSGESRFQVPTVRRLMSELSASVDGDVITGIDYKNRNLRQERLLAGFLLFFGMLALVISCLGIYGMLAYTVARRTPEIGLRMVLGAQWSDVVSMVIVESLTPVAVGVAMGVIVAFALTRWVQSMLFGVSISDPSVLSGAAALFLITAAIAAFAPARRASRIDPMRALRYE